MRGRGCGVAENGEVHGGVMQRVRTFVSVLLVKFMALWDVVL